MATNYAPKVLIVDDDLIICEDLKTILENHGYPISGVAALGEQAIMLAKQNPPDLILMDIKLNAGLNGLETVTIIDAELGRTIPVIFVTALNPFEYCRLSLASDGDHQTYLEKPYTEDQLISCIEMALKNSTSS